MSKPSKFKKGFTLIELIVSISIFIVIMTISMGSIISILETNRKSRSLKTAIANLNLVLETISKEIRFGRNYHCIESGNLTLPQNCPSGNTFISFLTSDNIQVYYKIVNGQIGKEVGGNEPVTLTSPEIVIDWGRFYVTGTIVDNLQPKVLIILKGHAGSGKAQTNFDLQTLISQRSLDS